VTIFLGLSIMLAPVIGSRPLRSFFVLTQNLPNPLIRTSSPEARLGFDQFEKDFDQFNCLIPWMFASANALTRWSFVWVIVKRLQ
jgi:hypothetical protein